MRWRLFVCWTAGLCLLLGCSSGGPTPGDPNTGGKDRPNDSRTRHAPRDEIPHAEREECVEKPRSDAKAATGDCPIQLDDVTAVSGIAFRHTDGGSGRRYIVETVVAGLATFDYDGDGLIDIYFLNGAPLPGTKHEGPPPRHALYKNLGGFRFRDVTDEAGVANTGYGMGVTAGDYDNDGHPDLYLNNFGPNVLYRNNGDGAFTDVTARAGVVNGDKVGAGTAFLDIDGDGNLDLYVANYVDFTYDKHITRMVGPYEFSPGPRDYPPMPDTLYRNHGDGTFGDVSRPSGIASVAGPGMGVIALDYDEDGDADVFVCNDNAPNFLFRNDGHGKFEEVGLSAGVAYDIDGGENGNMGADCGDYDNDGRLDLFVTNYQAEIPMLLRNLGRGSFENVSAAAGVGGAAFPHVKWGTGLVDFDNDGNRDLFIACGHFMDNIRYIDDRTDVRVPNVLLRNTGDKRFVDVSGQCGSGLKPIESSKGAALDDLDNDGDVDIVVLNQNAQPTVIRNMLIERGSKSHWLQVRLRGVKGNRDGVGARVRVVAGNLVQIDEVHSGRGYQSHYGSRLHFGLGKRDRIDRIEVRWHGGGTDVLENVVADRLLTITEGSHDTNPERAVFATRR